jgi:hypothetical protein
MIDAKQGAGAASVGPVTFHVVNTGKLATAISGFVAVVGFSVTWVIAAVRSPFPHVLHVVIAGSFLLVSAIVFLWLIRRWRRQDEVLIDPTRGEILIGRHHAIPFANVRRVELAKREVAYQQVDVEGGTSFPMTMTYWSIDIGGGCRLFVENRLSRKRVAKIAAALRVRVEAYRTRTGEGTAPRPRPGGELLEGMAAKVREGGGVFQETWLALDGPLARWMRDYHVEPDERTMGRDGELAQALRKAGFDLGDTPAQAVPPAAEPE